MSPDLELIRRCARGDADAMRTLIERHEAPARSLLSRLLGNPDDVEDALCEVFVRLWRTAPGYQGGCAPATWIHRIAVSVATDVLRRRRAARRALEAAAGEVPVSAPPSEEPEWALLNQERCRRYRRLARAALASLSPEEQVAVTLHYLEDCSYREMSEITGVPVTTLRMRLYRARRRMEKQLRKWLEDDELSYLAGETAGAFSPCAGC